MLLQSLILNKNHFMNRFIILISLILVNCGDSYDTPSNPNSIIGDWSISARSINNQSVTLGECEPFSIYTFNSDGSYSELIYAAVLNSDCLNNPSITFEGTWEALGESNYRFINSSETFEATIIFSETSQFTRTYGSRRPSDF